MTEPTPGLHPAQNRGLRECYAFARQLCRHWDALAPRLEGGPGPEELRAGSAAAATLLDELTELTEAYGLYGFPAAQGVGARIAGVRNVVADRTLERNQSLRMAVLDVQHLTTLLAYLAAIGEERSDERMTMFCGRWERKLKRIEGQVRRAAISLGSSPDAAIEPIDHGALGRAGHGLANAAGTLGEWVDRRAAERRQRR